MKNNNGFTLVELMIVIAIIGVLSTIAFNIYTNYTKKTNDVACLSAMKNYASLYVSEKSSENAEIINLPLSATLKLCAFTAPTDFFAETLEATALKGSGKTITCQVTTKVICQINE